MLGLPGELKLCTGSTARHVLSQACMANVSAVTCLDEDFNFVQPRAKVLLCGFSSASTFDLKAFSGIYRSGELGGRNLAAGRPRCCNRTKMSPFVSGSCSLGRRPPRHGGTSSVSLLLSGSQ